MTSSLHFLVFAGDIIAHCEAGLSMSSQCPFDRFLRKKMRKIAFFSHFLWQVKAQKNFNLKFIDERTIYDLLGGLEALEVLAPRVNER